jgi:hypothetical protein
MINYQMPNAFPIAPDNYRDGTKFQSMGYCQHWYLVLEY